MLFSEGITTPKDPVLIVEKTMQHLTSVLDFLHHLCKSCIFSILSDCIRQCIPIHVSQSVHSHTLTHRTLCRCVWLSVQVRVAQLSRSLSHTPLISASLHTLKALRTELCSMGDRAFGLLLLGCGTPSLTISGPLRQQMFLNET